MSFFLFTDIHQLIKRFNSNPKNKLEFRLVQFYPPSEEFTRILPESHAIYERYQMAIPNLNVHIGMIETCSIIDHFLKIDLLCNMTKPKLLNQILKRRVFVLVHIGSPTSSFKYRYDDLSNDLQVPFGSFANFLSNSVYFLLINLLH